MIQFYLPLLACCSITMISEDAHLEVPVDDTVGMAVVHRLQDLLDAVGGIGFRVELSGNNVFEQFPASHPEITVFRLTPFISSASKN